MGVMDGARAFIGPHVVQIDIANTCQNTCLSCWIRSPLLCGEIASQSIHRQQLPVPVVMRVLDELAEIGTECIYLSGGGDVFSHEHLEAIVRRIKSYPMHLTVHANFVSCREEQLEALIESATDAVTASVWAATPATYVATHPDKTVADFDHMLGLLRRLAVITRRGGNFRIHNVIMNQNAHELEAMVDLAITLGATEVNFVLVDTIPGRTDSLLLQPDVMVRLREDVARLNDRRESLQQKHGLVLADFDFFRVRIQSNDAVSGCYELGNIEMGPCYAGWMFLRILGDGTVNSCLKSWHYPLGNVHRDSIGDIWNCAAQREFRRRGADMTANREYFSKMGNNTSDDIGCYRSCDNLVNIQEMRDLLNRLPRWRLGLAKMTRFFM